MRLFFLFTLLFLPALGWAQAAIDSVQQSQQKTENNLLLLGSYRRHLNKNDIRTEGDRYFLSVPDNNGYWLGAEFERITSYGLMFSIGLGYGKREQEIIFNLNARGFLPGQAGQHDYLFSEHYLDEVKFHTGAFSIGYQHQPFRKSGVKIFAKAGANTIKYFKGEGRYRSIYLVHSNVNQPNIKNLTHFASTFAEYGSGGQLSWWRFQTYTWVIQAGLSFPVNLKPISALRLAVTYTFNTIKDTQAHGIYYNSVGERVGFQGYTDKFRTIGVTTSLVF